MQLAVLEHWIAGSEGEEVEELDGWQLCAAVAAVLRLWRATLGDDVEAPCKFSSWHVIIKLACRTLVAMQGRSM